MLYDGIKSHLYPTDETIDVYKRQGQVVPLAGGAFLRSGRPGGTAGPADAAAPTGARPRPLFGARRGAEAARPRDVYKRQVYSWIARGKKTLKEALS